MLLPSRQVFLIDDVAHQSLSRRDTRRDHTLWQAGNFIYEDITHLKPSDSARIAKLYAQLYLDKYSQLNPAYTEQFIEMSHTLGLIQYLVLRNPDGLIEAFGGIHGSDTHATMPLIGYNMDLDQRLGLYRLAFHAGADAEIEYTAFYLRHLSRFRRYPFAGLEAVANHIGIPLLKKYQL